MVKQEEETLITGNIKSLNIFPLESNIEVSQKIKTYSVKSKTKQKKLSYSQEQIINHAINIDLQGDLNAWLISFSLEGVFVWIAIVSFFSPKANGTGNVLSRQFSSFLLLLD